MAQEQEAPKTPNVVNIEQAGVCKKKVSIEIPQETIEKAVGDQYESLRKETVLPGFRKGRAPKRLLEKRFGKEASEQVKLKLIAEAMESALKDNNIDQLRDPELEHEKIEMPESGPLKFEFEVEVRPEITLPELKGITVEKTKRQVTDEQVNTELEQLKKYSGTWVPREDAPVEANDSIFADVQLKVEGVEEAEKLDNIEIFVRPNGFVAAIPVEKLDELLIGAKPGDKKQVSVEVPKTYFREEYRGKKVDAEIEIKEVKYLKPAEMNEDFLRRFGVEDEQTLRERMHENLEYRLEQQSKAEMADQIYNYLKENTNFELPTDIVAEQATQLLQRQYVNLIRQGLAREQLDERMAELRSSSEEQANEQLKRYFIMDEVASKLGVEITEEEVNGHIAQSAIQRGQRPERMREEMMRDGSLGQFRLQIREDKAIAQLLEDANVTEVEPKEAGKKSGKSGEKKAAKKSETSEKDESETKTNKKSSKKKTAE